MKEVWYVQGDDNDLHGSPLLFETKMDAERWARHLFPKEDEHKRYARIFYRRVHTMDDLMGVAQKPS